ncbi:hypothetical protein [Turneriella parva]|nr:hypothetical protein [Turneriella parva]
MWLMRYLTFTLYFFGLQATAVVFAEAGTRAKTMRNETQRRPKQQDAAPARQNYSYPAANDAPSSAPAFQPRDSNRVPSAAKLPPVKEADPSRLCEHCVSEEFPVLLDNQALHEQEVREKGMQTNGLSVNSRFALTSWNFNFSPAISYASTFFPTFELDVSYLGLDFSYMTTLAPQPSDLFRDLSIIGSEPARQSAMEYLRLGALPLVFLKNPLLRDLIAIDFRKTTKSTTIVANQNLYYFPYETQPGLTAQDSDLGTIYYEQKSAGSRLAYNIAERDWLFTIGFMVFRTGYFDVSYAKPYQMDADIYAGNVLIDRRVYLFEGQASGRGLMISLQNLYFPTWQTKRFYYANQELLARGFFWGVKELGLYWGSGTIRLQNGIDLVEKYRAFYAGETGRDPTVVFSRQVAHFVMGYRFTNNLLFAVEYRYSNYSLALRDSYDDAEYNYFLNHAINRDTVQQLAVNLTVTF